MLLSYPLQSTVSYLRPMMLSYSFLNPQALEWAQQEYPVHVPEDADLRLLGHSEVLLQLIASITE